MKPGFFRRKDAGPISHELQGCGKHFSALLPSADHGLYFDVSFTYDWEPELPQRTPLLHGDAVARSLLTSRAAEALGRYPIPMTETAEAAVNHLLSKEIREDRRLCVTGRAAVAVRKETQLAAHRRNEAAEQHRVEETARIARLEVLRELLLDRELGLVWWIDRYADLQFSTGDPKAKTESVLAAFRLVTGALQNDPSSDQYGENSLTRARVEELLTALQDPQTRQRALELLETVLNLLLPESEKTGAADQKIRST